MGKSGFKFLSIIAAFALLVPLMTVNFMAKTGETSAYRVKPWNVKSQNQTASFDMLGQMTFAAPAEVTATNGSTTFHIGPGSAAGIAETDNGLRDLSKYTHMFVEFGECDVDVTFQYFVANDAAREPIGQKQNFSNKIVSADISGATINYSNFTPLFIVYGWWTQPDQKVVIKNIWFSTEDFMTVEDEGLPTEKITLKKPAGMYERDVFVMNDFTKGTHDDYIISHITENSSVCPNPVYTPNPEGKGFTMGDPNDLSIAKGGGQVYILFTKDIDYNLYNTLYMKVNTDQSTEILTAVQYTIDNQEWQSPENPGYWIKIKKNEAGGEYWLAFDLSKIPDTAAAVRIRVGDSTSQHNFPRAGIISIGGIILASDYIIPNPVPETVNRIAVTNEMVKEDGNFLHLKVTASDNIKEAKARYRLGDMQYEAAAGDYIEYKVVK